jgi:hypothetical protein
VGLTDARLVKRSKRTRKEQFLEDRYNRRREAADDPLLNLNGGGRTFINA